MRAQLGLLLGQQGATYQVCALGSLSGVPHCSTVKDCGPFEPVEKMTFCDLIYFTHKSLDIFETHFFTDKTCIHRRWIRRENKKRTLPCARIHCWVVKQSVTAPEGAVPVCSSVAHLVTLSCLLGLTQLHLELGLPPWYRRKEGPPFCFKFQLDQF